MGWGEINHNNPVEVGARIRELEEQLEAAYRANERTHQDWSEAQERLGAVAAERDHARRQRDDAERKLTAARDELWSLFDAWEDVQKWLPLDRPQIDVGVRGRRLRLVEIVGEKPT